MVTSGFVVDVSNGEVLPSYMDAVLNQLGYSLGHIAAVGAIKEYFKDITMKYGLDSPTELRNYLKNSWDYIENKAVENLIFETFII